MRRILIAISMISTLGLKGYSQEYSLIIHPVEGEHIRGMSNASIQVKDSLEVYTHLKDILGDLREEGYLAASIDSLSFDSLGAEAWAYSGPRFEWGILSLDSLERKTLKKAGVHQRAFSGKPVKYQKLAAAQERIIQWYENNGYPFAGIYINNISFSESDQSSDQNQPQILSGELWVEPNSFYRIDTIHIKGEARLERNYFERLTGLESGDVYREERISKISDRIRETPFLEEIKPAELEFFEGVADIYTYIQKSQANQFNGIIGVFPNHEQTGKLFVTGDLHLYLVNSFGKGESFRFAWKALQPLTQELDVSIAWPYVFKSTVGLGFDFSLLKQDTSWLSVNPVLDLKFFLGGNNYFNIFYDFFSSSLISTAGLENASTLPSYADVTSSLYGLGIEYRNLDYLYNPRKGWDIQGRLGIGSRKIHKNPGLPESVYESVDLVSTKVKGQAGIRFFQPLGNRFSLYLGNRTGYLLTRNIFENELFRLGGIHSLRGVDENSIFASLYSLGTIETRFIFERNSNFFLFLDGGYYEKDLEENFQADFPFGFGAGVNLSTRAGIFSLVYAIGKQFDNPVNIGEAKIHIGYLNRF